MQKVIARYELWYSSCKFRNVIKTDKPCCDIYCHVCKHKFKEINDQPCDDCINKSTVYKPINFELDICEGR